ncbi:MAG: asparagine synthase-related protein [Acutalibacteraceae bacterium]|nr:asparagine synthase-related protein [Acutalibacteraceae bacterium]
MNNDKVEIKYFSGYIRNWKKLCKELDIPADLSRTDRENEIIKSAYSKWGLELTEHIYGMFAIAIWDNAANKLFCIRDQVGQKHMYYAVINGEFFCSGDINEIASTPGFEKKLNKRMLQQYLFYGFPIGNETFYEGLYKLMPGHYAVWNGKEVSVTRYWHPVFEPDSSKTVDEWSNQLCKTIDEIMSEEKGDQEFPYKESFLSGGVDSSYLFAVSDAQVANTVGYAESGFDESALARHTAEVLGKGFRTKLIEPKEYFDRIPEVIDKMGQPLGDASAVAFSLGCAAVKQYADVVYSGEGIDEFFGGYNAHKRVLGEGWTYLTCSHIMSRDVVRSLMLDFDENVDPADPISDLWKEVQGQDDLAQKLTIDISLWLEGDIYFNTDRTSTACGIELHTPFSDLRLFNDARRIPANYKFAEDQNKFVFRKAASSVLPDEVAFRKKVGFAVPIRKWLADTEINRPVEEKLFGDTSKKFFDQNNLRSMWENYLAGEEMIWGRIYAIYAFLIWYDLKFVDNK